MQQLSATTPPPEYMPSLPQRNHTASPQDRPNTSSSTPMPQGSPLFPQLCILHFELQLSSNELSNAGELCV